MAKSTRKASGRKGMRKGSRKMRGGNSNMRPMGMGGGKAGRKASRKGRKGLRIVQRVWSPFNHLLRATGESAQRVGSTAGRIAKETVYLPAGVGRTFAKHSNMAVRNTFYGGNRHGMYGGRRGSRRAGRKGRRTARK
jgi:hypothetical protein